MEWRSSESDLSPTNTAGKKRSREAREEPTAGGATNHQQQPVLDTNKRGCSEPLSWWTCLMLGVSENQSRLVNRS